MTARKEEALLRHEAECADLAYLVASVLRDVVDRQASLLVGVRDESDLEAGNRESQICFFVSSAAPGPLNTGTSPAERVSIA